MRILNSKLVVSGTQDFMGIQIPVIEGGFGDCKRVLTDKQISEIHNQPNREIRRRIKDNIKRFKNGVDYIDLKGVANDHTFIETLGYHKSSISQAENIYLLSERGYSKLIKIMDTDLAWEIMDKLIEEYFTMRQVIKSDEQLKKDLAYKLLVGGVESIEAHKQLVALETAPLIKSIEGKDAIIDRVIKDDGLYALGTVGKMLKPYIKEMGARKIFDYMRKENILIDNKGCQNHNLPYAKYDNYFEIKNVDVDCGLFNRSEIKSYLNGKGMKFFLNRLVKNGLLTNSQKETVINKL